jgi:carbonic anhydrase
MERRPDCGFAAADAAAGRALCGTPGSPLRRAENVGPVAWQNRRAGLFCRLRETDAGFSRKGCSGGDFRLHGSLVRRGASGYTAPVTTDQSIAALTRLQEGNKRFIANVRGIDAMLSQQRRAELVAHQQPFAIVLGCSDSRAPAEIVFDQGLGDLFVIRIAGNIVAPSGIASVEFAAQRFGIPLVVLMGHTGCGAIEAALESISRPDDESLNNLRSIVDRVKPAIEPLTMTRPGRPAPSVCAGERARRRQPPAARLPGARAAGARTAACGGGCRVRSRERPGRFLRRRPGALTRRAELHQRRRRPRAALTPRGTPSARRLQRRWPSRAPGSRTGPGSTRPSNDTTSLPRGRCSRTAPRRR